MLAFAGLTGVHHDDGFYHPQHTLTDRPSADLWDIGIGLGRIVAIERAAAADADIWTGFRSGRITLGVMPHLSRASPSCLRRLCKEDADNR